MQLKSMSVDRLVDLREKVETALRTRIAATRSELEAKLKELPEVGGFRKTSRRGLRGRVSPKYRNPDNPAETWSGRGLRPRWLVAKLKRGAREEDFLIDGAPRKRRKEAKSRKAKTARTTARPRKAAKARRAAKPREALKRRKAAVPLNAETNATSPAAASPPPDDRVAETSAS
jgi:DNA-binding protein H-NS